MKTFQGKNTHKVPINVHPIKKMLPLTMLNKEVLCKLLFSSKLIILPKQKKTIGVLNTYLLEKFVKSFAHTTLKYKNWHQKNTKIVHYYSMGFEIPFSTKFDGFLKNKCEVKKFP